MEEGDVEAAASRTEVEVRAVLMAVADGAGANSIAAAEDSGAVAVILVRSLSWSLRIKLSLQSNRMVHPDASNYVSRHHRLHGHRLDLSRHTTSPIVVVPLDVQTDPSSSEKDLNSNSFKFHKILCT